MSKSYYVPSNRTDASKVKFKDENFPNVNNVKDALKQLKQSSSLIDLSSYALKTDIPTVTNDLTDTLKSNYDKAYAHSQSKHFDGNYNNLTNKPTIPTKTSELINDSKFLTSVPSEYITETELDTKGYLTEHQDISGKVDKVEGKELSTNDYTTIEKDKLEGIEEGANKYMHPTTHGASMITQDATHRFVTDEEKTKWNSKSDFNGSYNDLTDKPIIPSIEGLATETYINNMIAFNDNGELVITINGVSKIFVPKTVE